MPLYTLNYLYLNKQMTEEGRAHVVFDMVQDGIELESTSGLRNAMRR